MPRRNRRKAQAKKDEESPASTSSKTKSQQDVKGELPLNITAPAEDKKSNIRDEEKKTDPKSVEDAEDAQVNAMLSVYEMATHVPIPLNPRELSFVCFGEPEAEKKEPETIWEAVDHRCKILDAMYLFCLPTGIRPKVTWTTDEDDPRLGPKTSSELSDAYVYHLILAINRGIIYVIEDADIVFEVPSVLFEDMKLTESPGHYAKKLANFDIRRTDGRWLTWLKLEGLEQGLQESMTITWRPYLAFKTWENRPNLSFEVNRAAQFCKKLASFRPSWDYHPCTWSKDVKRMLDPLFPNVWSLIVSAFTKEEVMEMILKGQIASLPQESPEHFKWKFWNPAMLVQPRNFIFVQSGEGTIV